MEQNKDQSGAAVRGEAVALSDYEEVLADHRRLVRELDVALNGEAGAAKQASLGDIVRQVKREGIRSAPVLARAADALDSQPSEWLPTAEAINSLPEGVRKYVHNLVANSDPAGTVAHNTLLTDNCENLQVAHRKMADALEEVRACFGAAEAEGLSTALAETSDEGLKDLVERRLMHAFYVAEPFSSQPTDGGVRNG